MLRRLRENGPIALVPIAWTFATAAHLDLLAGRTVLIAHIVMVSIIAVFTLLSWGEMADGVLLAWRRVLLAGFVITLLGVVGLLADPQIRPLLTVTVVGWMLIPAAGLAYTGQRIARRPRAYIGGAALSGVGALAYLAGVALPTELLVLAGLTLTNVGQTAGIAAAVVDY